MIVYLINNSINSKVYIGLTTLPIERIRSCHKCMANKGEPFRISRAINKYGIYNFKWSVLKICNTTEEMFVYREHYIKIYNSMNLDCGYNCTTGAKHTVFSKEVVEVMKENNTGITNPNYGKGLYGEANPNFGTKASKATRKKMSKSQLKRFAKNPCVSGEKHYNYGNHYSEERNKKQSVAMKKSWKRKKAYNDLQS